MVYASIPPWLLDWSSHCLWTVTRDAILDNQFARSLLFSTSGLQEALPARWVLGSSHSIQIRRSQGSCTDHQRAQGYVLRTLWWWHVHANGMACFTDLGLGHWASYNWQLPSNGSGTCSVRFGGWTYGLLHFRDCHVSERVCLEATFRHGSDITGLGTIYSGSTTSSTGWVGCTV